MFKPDLNRNVQFIFRVISVSNNDDEVRFLKSVIRKSSEKNKIWASFSNEFITNDTIYNAFSVEIFKLGVKYPGFASNKFLGNKRVDRRISGSIKIVYTGSNFTGSKTDSIVLNYHDKINFDDINMVESYDYNFTRAKHPEVSFYEELVFPAAIILVTVAAAILFFTIRTK